MIGVTNQRLTKIVWEKTTGKPGYNAVIWQDTRTQKICNQLDASGGEKRMRAKTKLPITTTFACLIKVDSR